MEAFLGLPARRRAELFEQAADKLGLTPGAIEKDFWVCWVLRELFMPDADAHLTFKGGTSLSKCWGLIERFSEDVDLVVDREFLGFAGDNAPEAGASRRERERRAEAVSTACRSHVNGSVLPGLVARAGVRLGDAHPHVLKLDPDADDQQAILLEFESLFPGTGYLRPVVKIELGARSDTEPVREPEIAPYVATIPAAELASSSFKVRAVAAERTFWEKVSLLHEAVYTSAGPGARLSRHYYDLWCLDQKGVGATALGMPELFRSVAAHRRLFFRRAAEAQRALNLGTLRLVPEAGDMQDWRDDFEAMREMFFRDPPSFEVIMAGIQDLEQRVNLLSANA